MKRSLLLLLVLSGCGYRSLAQEHHSIEIPYVLGDRNGELTSALAKAINNYTPLSYRKEGGDWILHAQVVNQEDTRIGYAYDAHELTGERINRLISTEGRRALALEITVTDRASGATIYGPQIIHAEADYDFVNEDNIDDLSFVNSQGERETVLAASLGQLDAQEGASLAAYSAAFQAIAKKIAATLANLNLLGHDPHHGAPRSQEKSFPGSIE